MVKKCKYHLIIENPKDEVLGIYFHIEDGEEIEKASKRLAKQYKFKKYKIELNPFYMN